MRLLLQMPQQCPAGRPACCAKLTVGGDCHIDKCIVKSIPGVINIRLYFLYNHFYVLP